MSSFTVGTSGRAYSTWTSAIAAVSVADILDSYDDSAFNEAVTDTKGLTIRAASGERHDGTAGTGVRNIRNADVTAFTLNTTAAATLEGIEVSFAGVAVGSGTAAVRFAAANTSIVRQMIMHDHIGVVGGTTNRGVVAMPSIAANLNHSLNNSVIYKVGRNASTASMEAVRIEGNDIGTRVKTLANVTLDDAFSTIGAGATGILIVANTQMTLKNTVVTGVTAVATPTCLDVGAGVVRNNNASEDATATGTGSLASITRASQYVSTVDGSQDYHLKAGADCIGAGADLGTTPSGVELDIDGYDRDAAAVTWDIGADQYVAVGGVNFTRRRRSMYGAGIL